MTGTARWLLVAAMVATPVLPLEAQGPPRRGGAGPAMVDRAAARALRLADELELSEGQREELRAIRSEALAAMETLERDRLAARQEFRARRRAEEGGEAPSAEELRALRAEARSRMEALRERERELAAPVLGRYEEVLSAETRLRLREMSRDRRPGARGVRARRGMDRGGRMERPGRMERAGARFRRPGLDARGPRGRGGEGGPAGRWRNDGGG